MSGTQKNQLRKNQDTHSEDTCSEDTSTEQGFALISFFIFLLIATLVIAGSLQLTSDALRSTNGPSVRAKRFMESEETYHLATSWLRENSSKIVLPFSRNNFYSLFYRTAPSYGSNDVLSPVYTQVKLVGRNQSAILTNDNALAVAAFPITYDIATGQLFPASRSFSSATLGTASVRVTLVDAIAEVPAKDFGPPPNPAPQTDFIPVYRVDAMNESDRGTHYYGYIVGQLERSLSAGFYGRSSATFSRNCDSYNSTAGAYSVATRQANCIVGSDLRVTINRSSTVYGEALSNGTVLNRGKVCADFAPGCPNPGTVCQGSSCNVPLPASFDPWASYCPTEQPLLTISANTVLRVSSDLPRDKCWAEVRIRAGRVLTLETTQYSYFFRRLTLEANAKIVIQPRPATEKVQLYLNEVQDRGISRLNGSNITNTTGTPVQLRINYLGTATLALALNQNMLLSLYAPAAQVNISGSKEFFGLLSAKVLNAAGTVILHQDEALAGGGVKDVKFTQKGVGQFYR